MSDDRLAPELDHVLRRPLPWRRQQLTECGLAPERCKTITASDLAAKVRRVGQQRAAFSTCMTCANRVHFNRQTGDHVEDSIVGTLRREVQSYRRDDVLETELRAIAALVERHRDEYDAIIDDLTAVTDLAAKRVARNRSRVRGKVP